MALYLFLVWLFVGAFSNAQEIFYSGFKQANNNLTLNNAAHIETNGLLRLTNITSELIGHAFYSSPLRIKTSPFSPALSFSTVFAFVVVPEYKTVGGHGFAFAMTTDKNLEGALSSQYLGLFNKTTNGADLGYRVFAVEFDTIMNSKFADINDNHVGIDINNLQSRFSTPACYYVDGDKETHDLDLKSGNIIFAWIDYDSSNTRVDVGLSLSNQRPERMILTGKVDLSPHLDEFVYVGFSASTGRVASSSHYILGWSFNVNQQARLLQPFPMPSLPKPIELKKSHILQIKIVAVAASLLILLLLLSLWFCVYKMKKKKNKQSSQANLEDISDIMAVDSLHMEFNTIRAATQNFATDRKLGEGGFGSVYKGTLEIGQEIAVKRLSSNSGQGTAEFKTEVGLVAQLQHRNLVKLLGFCISGKERILVYEFLSNSSLDKFLFGATKRTMLNWETRFKIISGIAKGLLYLHEDSRLKIVHRDLKSSNVLLDEAMNPKISDFGLAKLFGVDQTQDATNKIVGTYGYMAPEYKFTGHYSVKSDVYSFGVMIIELVSGKRNYMDRPHYGEALLHRAWRFWNESAALKLVDETLGDDYSREEVLKCIHIGLLCIQENAAKRPNMTTVVAALGGQDVALSLPSPPVFFGDIDSTSLVNIANASASMLNPSSRIEGRLHHRRASAIEGHLFRR